VTPRDLHLLPRVHDSWTYLYVEHCRIEQDAKAIAVHDASGRTPVPCATLTLLMLGPGTAITHAAVRTLAESGCMIAWCGEQGVRLYATGSGETRSAANLIRQARLASDPSLRLSVVRKMYCMRFGESLDPELTIQQIRGREGARVRDAYARAAKLAGVEWRGRIYRRDDWHAADLVNRALSCANSCLYGLCHAAIISAGYSPALGFIHTGKALSFVYDIADLYKADLTVPEAFQAVSQGASGLETRIRRACRERFHREAFLGKVIPDIEEALAVEENAEGGNEPPIALDGLDDAPGRLWDPTADVDGGVNHADPPEDA
jgi:CRISPR-associated protein Cas1